MDYTYASGMLSFAPGEMSKVVTVYAISKPGFSLVAKSLVLELSNATWGPHSGGGALVGKQ